MKIEKNYLILCENFLLDEKQRASLINMYDVIWTQEVPATHLKILYVANFNVLNNASLTRLSISFTIKSPSGKLVFEAETDDAEIAKNQPIQSVGATFEANYVAIEEFGEYKAELIVDNKKIAKHSFNVKKPNNSEK